MVLAQQEISYAKETNLVGENNGIHLAGGTPTT
jgi:hypothetical protein